MIRDAIKWLMGVRQTPLDEQRQRLQERIDAIRELELRNRNAYAASRLEQLQAAGVPFFRDAPPIAPPMESRPSYHAVHVYETDAATGYPFVPSVKFEQDPLFGWPISGLGDWIGDLATQVPVGAFPREMFPDRPSTLRTQIAQDAIRFQSRAWFETIPQYSGPIGHLRNYIVGAGLTIDVVPNETEESEEGGVGYEQGTLPTPQAASGDATAQDDGDADGEAAANPNEALAAEIQKYLDGFAKYRFNRLNRRVWESVLNLFRDGEDCLRLFPGGDFPEIRSVDTSTIRGPHNEINGPWSYGVLTSWPKDFEDVQAYHLWHADNSHEDVSPKTCFLAKLDTTGANVKRGVPLAYKIRKQLPQMAKLLDCMAVGEAARQAIPYIQQYNLADKSAVRMATPSALDAWDAANTEWQNARDRAGDTIQPGQVQHISRGMEFQDTPQGRAESGAMAYRTLCEAIASALNVPLWFVSGTADSENYASSLVSESPVVQLVTHYQQIVTDHYQQVMEAVVDLSGQFPEDWRDKVSIHAELPSPVSRDEDKAVDSDLKLLDKKLISPQHVCTRHKLDFEEETDLIAQAEANGWQAQTAMDLMAADAQLNAQNGGDGPPQPPKAGE